MLVNGVEWVVCAYVMRSKVVLCHASFADCSDLLAVFEVVFSLLVCKLNATCGSIAQDFENQLMNPSTSLSCKIDSI